MSSGRYPLANPHIYHFNVIYNHARSPLSQTPDTENSLRLTECLVERLRREGFDKSYYYDHDALPGRNIFEELFRVIKSSEYTLVILTRGFLDNCWGQYSRMAAFKTLLDNHSSSSLIPITVDLRDGDVPNDLSVNDIIAFTSDWEHGCEKQWNRLVKVMKKEVPLHVVQNEAQQVHSQEAGDGRLHTESGGLVTHPVSSEFSRFDSSENCERNHVDSIDGLPEMDRQASQEILSMDAAGSSQSGVESEEVSQVLVPTAEAVASTVTNTSPDGPIPVQGYGSSSTMTVLESPVVCLPPPPGTRAGGNTAGRALNTGPVVPNNQTSANSGATGPPTLSREQMAKVHADRLDHQLAAAAGASGLSATESSTHTSQPGQAHRATVMDTVRSVRQRGEADGVRQRGEADGEDLSSLSADTDLEAGIDFASGSGDQPLTISSQDDMVAVHASLEESPSSLPSLDCPSLSLDSIVHDAPPEDESIATNSSGYSSVASPDENSAGARPYSQTQEQPLEAGQQQGVTMATVHAGQSTLSYVPVSPPGLVDTAGQRQPDGEDVRKEKSVLKVKPTVQAVRPTTLMDETELKQPYTCGSAGVRREMEDTDRSPVQSQSTNLAQGRSMGGFFLSSMMRAYKAYSKSDQPALMD